MEWLEPRTSLATGNPDQDIPWPLTSGVHDLATILDKLIKAQPWVIERTAKPGTQAWLVKDGRGILQGH